MAHDKPRKKNTNLFNGVALVVFSARRSGSNGVTGIKVTVNKTGPLFLCVFCVAVALEEEVRARFISGISLSPHLAGSQAFRHPAI